MSGRTTAEIVADLRDEVAEFPLTSPTFLADAADRLVELSRKEVHAEFARDELATLDALRPPCPTCDGRQTVHPIGYVSEMTNCPDCVDGKMSWADSFAQLKALHEFPREDATAAVWVALQGLRSVRAEQGEQT